MTEVEFSLVQSAIKVMLVFFILTCTLMPVNASIEHQSTNELRKIDEARVRETRDYVNYWRRLPTFGYKEIPRDTTENCLAYCRALYGNLLKQSLYLQACTGVCKTIDECSGVADCVADSSCINTADGFMCLCPSGYHGNGRISGERCTDVNECTDGTASCVPEATCTNTEGGYICQCEFGYNGDGRSSGTGCTNILPMLTQLIKDTMANQPVVQMVSITVDNARRAKLRSISTSTLLENTSPLATFSIADPSQPRTRGRIFAYRPSYADNHGSNIGVLLFGVRAVFLCVGATANPKPICSLFTHNNVGFHGGRPFIEASFDRFQATNLPVYGFGVESCPELTPDCFPSGQEVTIVCYLPRDLCGDGPGLEPE